MGQKEFLLSGQLTQTLALKVVIFLFAERCIYSVAFGSRVVNWHMPEVSRRVIVVGFRTSPSFGKSVP